MSLQSLITAHKLTDAATIKTPPRLVVVSQALEKQGKTHWSLTAPKPLVHLNMDRPLEEAVLKQSGIAGTGQIVTIDFKVPGKGGDINQEACKAEWKRFTTLLHAALDEKEVRTVVVDGANLAYDLVRMAEFGKLTQVPPIRYKDVNAYMVAMYNAPFSRPGKNAVFIHRMKKQYMAKRNTKGEEVEVWSGKYERTGFSGAGFEAQVVIRHMRRAVQGGGTEFGILVEDSGIAGETLIGTELWGLDCNFASLGMMAHPTSQYTDWI